MPGEDRKIINLEKGRRFQTGDEATKTAAQRGGVKSGEARRRKKAARKAINEILTDTMPASEEAAEILHRYGLDDDASMQSVILFGLCFQAARGNVKAAEAVFRLSEDDSETKLTAKKLELERERIDLLKQDIDRKAGRLDDSDCDLLPVIIDNRRPAAGNPEGDGGGE